MCQPVTALQAVDGWWLLALCLIVCSSWWQLFFSSLPHQHCHNGLWQCSNAGLPAQMHIYSFCWQKLNSFFRTHSIHFSELTSLQNQLRRTLNYNELSTFWEQTIGRRHYVTKASQIQMCSLQRKKKNLLKTPMTQRTQITYVHQKKKNMLPFWVFRIDFCIWM